MTAPTYPSAPPSSAAVSERMSRLGRTDTAPELSLRRALHRRGLRYRVHQRVVPALRSRADIVFRPARIAVYVDGCFWHSCPVHGTLPKSNAEFWTAKLAANRRRDEATDEALRTAGWLSIRVWEHEDPDAAADRIEALVRSRATTTRRTSR